MTYHLTCETEGHLEQAILVRNGTRGRFGKTGVTRIVRTPRRRYVWGKGVVTFGVDATRKEYKKLKTALKHAKKVKA